MKTILGLFVFAMSTAMATSYTAMTYEGNQSTCVSSPSCGSSISSAVARNISASVSVHTPCPSACSSSIGAMATFSVDFLITGPTGDTGFFDYWLERNSPNPYGELSFGFTGAVAGFNPVINNYSRLVFTYGTPFTFTGSVSLSCSECWDRVSVGIYQPIYVRDSTLQVIATILPDSGVTTLAFPTPEPSTFALLIAAFASLGIFRRRV